MSYSRRTEHRWFCDAPECNNTIRLDVPEPPGSATWQPPPVPIGWVAVNRWVNSWSSETFHYCPGHIVVQP